MKIIDPRGEWYINNSAFQMADSSGVVYPPKEPLKIAVTDWVKSQPFMAPHPDPLAQPAKKEEQPKVSVPLVTKALGKP